MVYCYFPFVVLFSITAEEVDDTDRELLPLYSSTPVRSEAGDSVIVIILQLNILMPTDLCERIFYMLFFIIIFLIL